IIRRPPISTLSSSSAASDVYKRQLLALYSPHIFYLENLNFGAARSHPINCLKSCGKNGCLNFIKTRRDKDISFGLTPFSSNHYLDPANPAGLLEITQIKISPE